MRRSRPGSARSVAWADENPVQEQEEDQEELAEQSDDDEGNLVIKGEDDIPKVVVIQSLTIINRIYI